MKAQEVNFLIELTKLSLKKEICLQDSWNLAQEFEVSRQFASFCYHKL